MQVCATLLGARHVPERLCGSCLVRLLRGAIASARPFFINLPIRYERKHSDNNVIRCL